jgi:protocatechuate 3,4-dioxygenase, alpha subunit
LSALTPFQTVGPYLHIGLRAGVEAAASPASRIVVRGRLIDGKGVGIPDGALEWWHPSLVAVRRSMTGEDGAFVFEAFKPSVIDGPGGDVQAPHFAVRVLARGILTHYVTRLYFADDPANAADPILKLVPENRRNTLLAHAASADEYRFDVVLQGQNETVFFDL